MENANYPLPVAALLELGERQLRRVQPYDYLSMGINSDHLSELVRMSRDESWMPMRTSPARWAPLHATRALIQLRVEEAIEPLARLLECPAETDIDDTREWLLEHVPDGLVAIGPASIPAMVLLLRKQGLQLYSRVAAAQTLAKIGQRYPRTRSDSVAHLSTQLDRFEENEPELNGWLIACLVRLSAVEAAPAIERAFAADCVDETVVGDWDEVAANLGLRPRLTDEELAARREKRHAAHGWLSPEEMLARDEARPGDTIAGG
jgi:hypothetical protein